MQKASLIIAARVAVECRNYQNVTFVSQGLGVDEGIILAVRDNRLFTLSINE